MRLERVHTASEFRPQKGTEKQKRVRPTNATYHDASDGCVLAVAVGTVAFELSGGLVLPAWSLAASACLSVQLAGALGSARLSQIWIFGFEDVECPFVGSTSDV